MELLIVTNTYPPADVSGVGTLVSELARRLAADGHRVTVVTRRAAPGDPFARATGGPKVLFPLLALLAWWRVPAAEVVHLHESDGVLVAVAHRLARSLGRRRGRGHLLATLQVSYRRERLAVRPVTADGEPVSRPTAGERLFAWLRAPLLALAGRLTARLADAVIAPSRRTAEELDEDYGARRVRVIPNGVRMLEPVPPPGRPGAPVVLYAGRLRTRKAVAVLVEAFAAVRAELPGALLVLAGDGEQRPQLEAQISRLGLGAAVRLLGAVPPEGVAAELASCDVFCLPSLYEGLPLALLEAMAAERPVVATAVAGNPEAVVDGVSGLLVPPESAGALASALVALGNDPERCRRMGEAARRRVGELFTIERVVTAHLALLAEPDGGEPPPGADAAPAWRVE